MTLTKPTLAADLEPEWYERVREAISVSRAKVRTAQDKPTIQVWSDGRRAWLDLQLPTGNPAFASTEERDGVWNKLMGE